MQTAKSITKMDPIGWAQPNISASMHLFLELDSMLCWRYNMALFYFQLQIATVLLEGCNGYAAL
jgi:hypothetical protein